MTAFNIKSMGKKKKASFWMGVDFSEPERISFLDMKGKVLFFIIAPGFRKYPQLI